MLGYLTNSKILGDPNKMFTAKLDGGDFVGQIQSYDCSYREIVQVVPCFNNKKYVISFGSYPISGVITGFCLPDDSALLHAYKKKYRAQAKHKVTIDIKNLEVFSCYFTEISFSSSSEWSSLQRFIIKFIGVDDEDTD